MILKENITRLQLIKKIGEEFPEGKGVEVGTFEGGFSREIVSNWNGTLYMVDVWRELGSEYQDINNHKGEKSLSFSKAIENTQGFEDRAIMIRATSKVASSMFNDDSLDFVYIDANHAYDYVVEDIKLWYPKIRKGGYLCGHDYIDFDWYADPNYAENKKDKHIWANDAYLGVFGVNPAVDEFCKWHGYDVLRVTNEWLGSWYIKK